MSFLCRPGLAALLPSARSFSASAVLAKRKYRDRLPVPQDKTGLVIGKRRPPVFMEKQGISAKTHPIHVSWSRPNYMQTCNAEISGDVGGLETLGLQEIDLSQPTVELLDSQALSAASPEVKRVMSLEFARRRDLLKELSRQVVQGVQRHPRDFRSPEVVITLLTIKIRNAQHAMIQQWPYNNQPKKHHLTHLVSSRRRMLYNLRERDYKKFEWLLEKLNMLYKPMPWDTPHGTVGVKENIERKKSVEKLTDMWCEELKQHRLTAYRRQLESKQPEFLRRKAETLQDILDTERELGLPETVSEDDISSCVAQASEVEARLAREKEEVVEDFLVYKEEEVRKTNVYRG